MNINRIQELRSTYNENVFLIWGSAVASLLFNAFYFFFNNIGATGPDAMEYMEASRIFQQHGIGYCWQDVPVTLWRLPVLPLLLALCGNTDVYVLVQMGLSYFLSLWIFFIFLALKFGRQDSLFVGIFSMFIPYFTIAKCGVGTEFLQVFFFVFITYKVLYKEYDFWLHLVVTLFCFLRAEGFVIALLVFGLAIFSDDRKKALWVLLPMLAMNLWQYRNAQLFDTYTIVNPILSSRALIGSIYGAIYVEKPHEFHTKYNYYEGMDYKKKKAFVKEYKEVVTRELKEYIAKNPLDYIKHRLYWASKCYFYLSFNYERLPDENWHFSRTTDRSIVEKTNRTWSYKNLLEKKDYLRLVMRLAYHLGFALGHLAGLLFMLFYFKRFWQVLLIMATFGYVFIVEADMRYLIFPQMVSLCVGFYMLIQLLAIVFYHKKYGQFLRYVAVGGSCFVLEIVLFSIFLKAMGKDQVYLINTLTFCIALIWNYIASRAWIFETGKYNMRTEFLMFLGVGVVALFISNLVLWICIDLGHLAPIVAKILAVAVVVIWNYIMKKYFVFKG